MNRLLKNRKNKFGAMNQRGAVSMLSVTIFAIIITVIATSYIKIVISQQRNAIEYDRGTRAYYAAEVGVQDGARAIYADENIRRNGKSDCEPVGAVNGQIALKSNSYGLGYTCQIINVTPGEIRGSVVPAQKSTIMRIEPVDKNFSGNFQIVLRWSERANDPDDVIFNARTSGLTKFSSAGDWGSINYDAENYPIHPVLRGQFISHPTDRPSFGSNDISQRVVFMNLTDVAFAGTSPTLSTADSADKKQEQLFTTSACRKSDDFSASTIDFKGFSCIRTLGFNDYNLKNSAFYINLDSVYHSTDFSVEMLKSAADGGGTVPLANTQATIDVTGKSGDTTFRRVRQTLPLGGYAEKDGPNAALVVGEGVCKNFVVGTASQLYQAGCNP